MVNAQLVCKNLDILWISFMFQHITVRTGKYQRRRWGWTPLWIHLSEGQVSNCYKPILGLPYVSYCTRVHVVCFIIRYIFQIVLCLYVYFFFKICLFLNNDKRYKFFHIWKIQCILPRYNQVQTCSAYFFTSF